MTDPTWPRDEYDCLVGPLLTLLDSEAQNREIARYLQKEITEHFGLPPGIYRFTAFAERLRRWFDRGWRHCAQPVTVFVALVEEGTDVWRPVQARPLDGGSFRIIGVDADTSDETWQFPEGAIVKCQRRQFADGRSEMTVVEQVEEAG